MKIATVKMEFNSNEIWCISEALQLLAKSNQNSGYANVNGTPGTSAEDIMKKFPNLGPCPGIPLIKVPGGWALPPKQQ